MNTFKKFSNHLQYKIDLNKKVFFCAFLFLFTITSVIAQKGNAFGVRAGVNYNSNGNYFNSISMASEDPSASVGYHIGLFGKLGVNRIYIKPELVYTKTKSEYSIGDFNLQKIDAPVLVGVKIIGPLYAFAGPAFQYILDSELDNARISQIENDFSVGLNFGVAVNFNRIGIDLRYERGFSDNEATIITNNSSVTSDRLDTRANQLILSLSFDL
ncbi:outer membrane beta-barrel protein [uncultured Lacinutrix sp.]|uniref:outer membrane beta-barrel protein n=1 Tax=uncultured Lacinutrix sp. TaxID=574032 RepID=UPI00260759BD|nr:outer membrane beta-barrel protein [uncultured Lacinutrix sp.]